MRFKRKNNLYISEPRIEFPLKCMGIEDQFPRKYPPRLRPGVLTTDGIVGGGSPATEATPAIDADMLVDFENGTNGATITTTILGNGTHGSIGSWSSVTGTVLVVSTSGEQKTKSSFKVGATTYNDVGSTRGMGWPIGATQGDARFTPTSAWSSPVSFGFWYNPGHFTNDDDVSVSIFMLYDVNVNDDICLRIAHRATGAGAHNIRLYTPTGEVGAIAVTPGSWYWITGKYTKNTATNGARMSVYNSTGSIVGSEVVQTSPNYNPDLLIIGLNYGAGRTGSGYSYWDDLVIDTTNATYPLGP